MFRRSEEDEYLEYMSTCAWIKRYKKHYEAEILAIPRTEKEEDDFWAVWGHLSGRNYLNEIEPYEQNNQTLIYKNEVLTQEQIVNGTVRLNDNDCITVIFSK